MSERKTKTADQDDNARSDRAKRTQPAAPQADPTTPALLPGPLAPLLRYASEHPNAPTLRPLIAQQLRALQATRGNQYVQRMLARTPLAAAGAAAATVIGALSGAASLAGVVYSGGSDELQYTSGQADRIAGKQTQPKAKNYSAVCLNIDFRPRWPRPDLDALFKIHWQGNDYGEIGAARVRVDLMRTSEFSYSSLNVSFTPVKNLIQPGADRRTWQIQWDYEGNFDPFAGGEYWFQGSFAIDAFGNFKSITHTVRDLSLWRTGRSAHKIVRKGARVTRTIPPPPASTGPATPSP